LPVTPLPSFVAAPFDFATFSMTLTSAT